MEPEAEPLAPAAIESIGGITPYLSAYGIDVVRLLVDRTRINALIEAVYVADLGVHGRCAVRAFRTEQGAQQAGARNTNEVRDLRSPISTNLLRRPSPRGRPGVSNNPTFPYGRFVASCNRQDARARRAFKALELYDRDSQETEGTAEAE